MVQLQSNGTLFSSIYGVEVSVFGLGPKGQRLDSFYLSHHSQDSNNESHVTHLFKVLVVCGHM